jgi:hypothetical protein
MAPFIKTALSVNREVQLEGWTTRGELCYHTAIAKLVYVLGAVTILRTMKAESEESNLAKNASSDGRCPLLLHFLLPFSIMSLPAKMTVF